MPHAYTEDHLVEQPCTGLFAELGLINRQAVICRKCLVYNGFLFK